MPAICPACALNDQVQVQLLAALACGESYYAIGQRFGISAMAARRHERRCILGLSQLRELSAAKGADKAKARLLAEYDSPAIRAAILEWLKGDRPTKVAPAVGLGQLRRLRRERLALTRRT